jgi:hypothetical protein
MAFSTHTWQTGEQVTVAKLNEYLRDAMGFVADPPRCSVRVTAQTIGTVSETSLSWDTENYDTDGMFAVGTPTRVTIVTPGRYDILLNISIGGGAFLERCVAYIRVNGATYIAECGERKRAAGWPSASQFPILTEYRFVAGDYIEVRVYQENAGNEPCTATLIVDYASA